MDPSTSLSVSTYLADFGLMLFALFLVLLNGFFVAAEFAIVRLRATKVDALAEAHGWRGHILRTVHNQMDAYLSACQLGITLGAGVAFTLLIAIFLVLMIASSDAAAEERYTWRQTLDAIRQVETGGLPNEGVGARGDWRTRNGKRVAMALGPYQIWSAYHFDAAERDKSLTNYQSCLTSKAYSEKVVRAYMHRYSRADISVRTRQVCLKWFRVTGTTRSAPGSEFRSDFLRGQKTPHPTPGSES